MGLQLNIKNEEAVELASRMAEAEGLTKTEVILAALRDRQRQREEEIQKKVSDIMELCRPIAERLKANGDALSIDDLYDAQTGLPK